MSSGCRRNTDFTFSDVLAVGSEIGQHRIERELVEGGMGVVYRVGVL